MRTTQSNLCAAAAVRKFPSHAKLIEELTIRSESFRELCEDLAEAERALAASEQLSETLRSARRAECQGWVDGLTKEIEEALRETKVIRFAGLRLPGRRLP